MEAAALRLSFSLFRNILRRLELCIQKLQAKHAPSPRASEVKKTGELTEPKPTDLVKYILDPDDQLLPEERPPPPDDLPPPLCPMAKQTTAANSATVIQVLPRNIPGITN